ncbi:unnamed protein product, partial [Ectocarpus fasciculatus]
GGRDSGEEEQRTTNTESCDGGGGQRPPHLELAVVEEGRGGGGGGRGRNHATRAAAAKQQHQYRRSNSGVSLRSLRSVGSLNDMQHALVREPLSPASTVGQDDIQRLRSLLDTERSRRVAAETALSVGGGSVSSRRSGMCTPSSVGGGGGGGGTPKSRSSSYASFNKQAFARDLDPHGQEVLSPKSMPPGAGFSTPGRSRGGAGGAPSTPSRSYASLSNMHVGTPRAPRLSYSALHKFPSARAVEAHALEASSNGAKWARSAISRVGRGGGGGETKAEQLYDSLGQPQQSREQKQKMLLSVVTSILVHLFHCCRVEVRRRLRVRVDGLRAFVGGAEFVQLGGVTSGPGTSGPKASLAAAAAAGAAGAAPGGVMAQDTHELLYGELRRRHRTIAGLGRKDLVTLSARVLSRALKTEAKKEVGRMLVHQTWPTFEPVVRSYLALFVECALQEPQIEFDEAAGKEEPFDPEKHRPLASFSANASPRSGTTGGMGPGLQLDSDTLEPGFETDDDSLESGSDAGGNNNASPRPCCVVFPAVIASITRWPPSKAAKSGVILY